MTLIPCPECGREFSSNAAACPGCGNPAPQPLKLTFTSAEAKAIKLLHGNNSLPAIARVTHLPIPEVKRLAEALIAGQIPEEITIADEAPTTPDAPTPDGQALSETHADAPKPKPKPAKVRVRPQATRQGNPGCGALVWPVCAMGLGCLILIGAIAGDGSKFWMAIGLFNIIGGIIMFINTKKGE